MRCDEVMREMSLSGEERDQDAVARHLAECKACASWSEHAATFDRLWDATRPTEPSAESWDRLWSSVTARLDQTGLDAAAHVLSRRNGTADGNWDSPRSSPVVRSWRGLAALGLVGLAQAAALLLAVNLFWNAGDKNVQPRRLPAVPDVAERIVPSLDSVVDVEWGQVVLIRSDGPAVQITDLTALEPTNGEDPWYVFFNRVESASTVVAMTE